MFLIKTRNSRWIHSSFADSTRWIHSSIADSYDLKSLLGPVFAVSAKPFTNYTQQIYMLSRFSHVWLCATLWTVSCQAPLSMGFSVDKQYWSGFPCPPPGSLPDPGIEPAFLMSPALAGRFFTTSTTWHANVNIHKCLQLGLKTSDCVLQNLFNNNRILSQRRSISPLSLHFSLLLALKGKQGKSLAVQD